MADDEGVRRRDVLKGLGVTGAAAGIVATTATACGHGGSGTTRNAAPACRAAACSCAGPQRRSAPIRSASSLPPEAAVVVALVDTLIPKDDVGPGGVEVGVPVFIDREMVAPMAAAPACISTDRSPKARRSKAISCRCHPPISTASALPTSTLGACKTRGGKTFDQFSAADRTAALKAVEAGQGGVCPGSGAQPSSASCSEHHGRDISPIPMYGGNRNNAVWKMIGFPGAIGMYADVIEKYRNKRYDVAPKSIQDLS